MGDRVSPVVDVEGLTAPSHGGCRVAELDADPFDPLAARDEAGRRLFELVRSESDRLYRPRFESVSPLNARDVVGIEVTDNAVEVEKHGADGRHRITIAVAVI